MRFSLLLTLATSVFAAQELKVVRRQAPGDAPVSTSSPTVSASNVPVVSGTPVDITEGVQVAPGQAVRFTFDLPGDTVSVGLYEVVENTRRSLEKRATVFVKSIADNIPNTGVVEFNIPTDVPKGNYIIRVSNAAGDFVDSPSFVITPNPVNNSSSAILSSATGVPSSFVVVPSSAASAASASATSTPTGGPNSVTSPETGSINFVGETLSIEWENLVGSTVSIQLFIAESASVSARRMLKRQSTLAYTFVGAIANDITNTGSFDWVIPTLPAGNNYVVGIQYNGDGGANDGSAESFSGTFGIFPVGTDTTDVTIININTTINIINTTINIVNVFQPYFCQVCADKNKPPSPVYTQAPVPFCPPVTLGADSTATTLPTGSGGSSSSTSVVTTNGGSGSGSTGGDVSGSGSDSGSTGGQVSAGSTTVTTGSDSGVGNQGSSDSGSSSGLGSQSGAISVKAGFSGFAVIAVGYVAILL